VWKLKAEQSQRTIDGHLVEKKMADKTVAYSDKVFWQVAIEWLVATDQVSFVLHFILSLILILFAANPST
jgi:hypothetical protein